LRLAVPGVFAIRHENSIHRQAGWGIEPDAFAGLMSNRQSNLVPPQRDRVVARLIFPSTRFGIGLDAQFVDQRFGLGVYPFSCLAATQPGEHFRPFSSKAHAA
jgi:hypothetical protein